MVTGYFSILSQIASKGPEMQFSLNPFHIHIYIFITFWQWRNSSVCCSDTLYCCIGVFDQSVHRPLWWRYNEATFKDRENLVITICFHRLENRNFCSLLAAFLLFSYDNECMSHSEPASVMYVNYHHTLARGCCPKDIKMNVYVWQYLIIWYWCGYRVLHTPVGAAIEWAIVRRFSDRLASRKWLIESETKF